MSKFVSYLMDIAIEIGKSGMPDVRRLTGFQLAPAHMNYWAECDERKTPEEG